MRSLLLTTFVATILTAAVFAGEPDIPQPEPVVPSPPTIEKDLTTLSPLLPGFRWLFDGKSLKGWHKNRERIGHGTGGSWKVEEGAITGEQDPPGSGNGGILLTDETFGDFEVIFEVKPDWGVDSGFFVRSNEKGQCFQVMIDYHDNGNIGEIYREGLDGASNRTYRLAGGAAQEGGKSPRIRLMPVEGAKPPLAPEDWEKVWKVDDWNTIRVRVVGNPPRIETWLNGREITRYTSDKKFDDVLKERGHIAVQVHGGKGWPEGAKVRFRHIQIKELDAREAQRVSTNPAAQ